MFLVWGILVPLATFVMRFCKHRPFHLALHKWVMLSAASITLPAAGAALVARTNARSVAHATVGLTLSSVLILQVIAGAAMRNWLRSDKPPPKHWGQVKWFHRITGWLMVALGLTNCILGADMILPNGRWGVIAYVVLIIIGFIIALAIDEIKRDQTAIPDALKFDSDEARRISMSQAVNSMTIAEVRHNIQVRAGGVAETRGSGGGGGQMSATLAQATVCGKRVQAGCKWVILGSYVYDITTFIRNHPGGA